MKLSNRKKQIFSFLLLIIFLSPLNIKSEVNQPSLHNTIKIDQDLEVSEQISSSFTGKSYLVEIILPYNYDADRTEGFPVLYFPNFWHTDRGGNVLNYFDRLVSNTNYTEVFLDTLIPSMIIVGITITEEEFSFANFEDDLIDNPDLYHLFLQEELLPFINEQYNTDTSETLLMGWLEIGFFVVDTFFRYPNTSFTKFITVNGDLLPVSKINDERPYIYEQEIVFAERVTEGAEINVDIFLSAGRSDYDSYFPMGEISKAIFRRVYTKLNLRTNIFDDSRFRFYNQESVSSIFGVYNPEMVIQYRIEDEDRYVDEEVQFTFTGSEGNRTEVNYLWDFGDGIISTEISPTHIYTTAGGYKANLTVTDEFNQTYSYVYPAALNIKSGERPINLESTSFDLQNTESYRTKELEAEEVGYNMSWLILVPILLLVRKRLKY